MSDSLSNSQNTFREKYTLKILIIAIAGCLLYGLLAGFRSDLSVIIGIMSISSTLSYTDLQFANSICRFVTAFAAPVIAFLTLKRSNLFVLTLGYITTIAGLVCIAAANSLPVLFLGLSVLYAIGSACLSYGIIYGIISPLVGEKAAIIISTVFTFVSTFFTAIFSPIIQWLSNLFGYQSMLGIFCFIIVCSFPLVFLIAGKKQETVVAKQKRDIRFKDALSIILKNKITYVLIVFFLVLGFAKGFNNHFYTGMLYLDIPSMGVSVTFSLLKIVMSVSLIVFTAVVLKIKRVYLFSALILLLIGGTELLVAFLSKDGFAFLPFVYLSVIAGAAAYPLSNLMIRREYVAILIGSVVSFTSLFQLVGSGINGILGSLFFEIHGNFTLLAILELVAAVTGSVMLIVYHLKAKAEERETADAKENAECHKQ